MERIEAAPDTKTLAYQTKTEVQKYCAVSPQGKFYFFADEEARQYLVIRVPYDQKKLNAGVVVMAHIANDKIVIDVDNTDKPLIKALMQNAGIPREQIIRAYAGEKLPE